MFYWLYYNHLIKRTLTYQNKTTGIINLQLTRYLESEKILLPSFEEQHRIVKILDLAQSLIEKRKKAIAYLDDYIKAVFLDMFGDPVSNPKGWEVNKLSKVCTKIADGTHFSPPLVESGIPYVTAKHLKSSG
ncbi:MAG: restriction endonuclease subunit S, partial [Chlorobiota bacterium]